MSQPNLLIDGYNLLHALGMARSCNVAGGLERSRLRLLNYLLVSLTDAEAERTLVVFDAANAPAGAKRQFSLGGLDILFAPSDRDADSVIEDLIREHSAPRHLRVVSSDHRLQKAARRRKATAIDSEDFERELKRRTAATQQSAASNCSTPITHPKFTGRVSHAEVQHWLEAFGDIPEAKELKNESNYWQARVNELENEKRG